MCKNCGNGCNVLNKDERNELDELRSKVKIYEDICNPEKYREIWDSAFYSGKLAQETGEISVANMEKFYQEDMQEIIKGELKNLDLNEEYDGEIDEENNY